MTRDEAKKYMSLMLSGHHKDCTHNHYKDVENGIDKIYDDFENKKGMSNELVLQLREKLKDCTVQELIDIIDMGIRLDDIVKAVDDFEPSYKPLKEQIGGSHYKDMVIQPIDFITKNNIGFCEGNAIKYVCRWKNKNGLEDLKKAKHYIEILIESEKDK